MRVSVLGEAGYEWAMLGLSLSYNQPVENMPQVAVELLKLGGSHTKYLESIAVWLDVTATRGWWQQESTYRCGISRQSESAMHTILSRPLEQTDFGHRIPWGTLRCLNLYIETEDFGKLMNELPEGFLQRRIIATNYQTLRRMIQQRTGHKREQWKVFIDTVLENVEHRELLGV